MKKMEIQEKVTHYYYLKLFCRDSLNRVSFRCTILLLDIKAESTWLAILSNPAVNMFGNNALSKSLIIFLE